MDRPVVFYETCGRTLAVSLRLVGGPNANPPISSMGSKRGFARALLGVMGLRQGLGAGEVWMADPSEWGAVWPVIASPRAAEVAAILRGWKDREPRALWEECRAKGWGELETVEEVSGWLYRAAQAYEQGNTDTGFVDPVKRFEDYGASSLASSVEAVARWLVAAGWAYRAGEPESGFAQTSHSGDRKFNCPITDFASRLSPWPVPLRCHHGSCLDVPVPGDARGYVVYFDGSYKHPDGTPTTGYKQNIYAEDAREYLLAWSEAGAVVAVSDARPLDWLFPGWKTVRIDGERIGQKRTFSRQSAEWLTLNRPPAWTPGVQVGLFDIGTSPVRR